MRIRLVQDDPVDVAIGLWRKEVMGRHQLLEVLQEIAILAEQEVACLKLKELVEITERCSVCSGLVSGLEGILLDRALRARTMLARLS